MESSLVCCNAVIENEVAQGLTQKAISLTYAMAIISDTCKADIGDWPRINQAIIDKWGQKGLERGKRLAWKLIEEKAAKNREAINETRQPL